MAQWHCMIKGQQYGPVSDADIRQWITEGRLQASDYVWREGMAEWRPAAETELMGGTEAAGFGGAGVGPAPRYAGGHTGYMKSHRAGAVLALGIIGLVACFICGIIAWVMGSNDLKEMDAGRMDPSGRDMTNAGKICGMISTILAIVGFGIWILLFAIGMGSALM